MFNSIQPVCNPKVKDVRLTTFVSLIGTKIWLAKAADGGLSAHNKKSSVRCTVRTENLNGGCSCTPFSSTSVVSSERESGVISVSCASGGRQLASLGWP
jgi:hypothetical protein